MDELFSRIEAALPKTDNIKYQTQAEKLDWVEVAFGQYTNQECKEKWVDITTKVRASFGRVTLFQFFCSPKFHTNQVRNIGKEKLRF